MSRLAQDGFLLRELRLVEFELRRGALGVILRLFDALGGAGEARLQKIALSGRFEIIAVQVSQCGVDRRLGLADQAALNVFLVG